MTESTIARVTITRTVKVNLGDYSNADISVTLEGVVPVGSLWESTLHQVGEETENVLADEMDILLARRVRAMIEQWGDNRLSSFVNMDDGERETLALRLIREMPGYSAMLALAIVRYNECESSWVSVVHDTAQIIARKREIEIKGEADEPAEQPA